MIEPKRIEENYRRVLGRIAAAAARAGRDPGGVTLVAVTKSVGVEEVRILHALGHRDFGENRIQPARDKIAATRPLGLRWHMIGHLQRNKVKEALENFALIHSLDSLRLAEEIERRAAGRGEQRELFVEVNVSGETSKFGLRPDEVVGLLEVAARLPHLHITGLMTMAPFSAEAEASRPYFRQLRQLQAALREKYPDLVHLSMGMSQDFEVAIEEGADFVRIGTALFAPQ